MTKHVTIPEHIQQKIAARKPFKDEHDVQGYRTRGGTYIIATQGLASDTSKPRDLLAIVLDSTFQLFVVVLWPATAPEFVRAIERIVEAENRLPSSLTRTFKEPTE